MLKQVVGLQLRLWLFAVIGAALAVAIVSVTPVLASAQHENDTSKQTFVQGQSPLHHPSFTLLAQDAGPDAGSNDVSCRNGGLLGWLVCPVIEFFAESTEYISNEILQPFLQVDPLTTDTSGNNPIYGAWGSIRTLANVLLIPVFLVLIFAQATSVGLDAYSVKKALPRLGLAVIGIQLSYFIAAIFVDIFNIIGVGIGDLLLSAFNGASATIGEGSTEVEVSVGGNIGEIFGGYGLLALFGAGGLLWVWGVGLGAAIMTLALFVLVPLFLAIILTFFTLVVRQGIITVLIVFAPIAFVSWVLPNTQKWFKQWLELLLKALFMYPLIMILLAGGKIFASVITSDLGQAAASAGSGGEEGVTLAITVMAALVAMAAPLFLVPATFKFAGSAMAAVGGMASNFRRRGAGSIQGDSRDPNSLRGRTTRRRRQKIDSKIAGYEGRFQGGDTNRTRKSLRPWKRSAGEQVPTLRSNANQILNSAGARFMDVEGASAQHMMEARKRVQSYAQTGQEEPLFVASLMGGISNPNSKKGKAILKERLAEFGKEKLADNPSVIASAKRISSDRFMTRAAMEHVATKAKNGEELGTLRDAIYRNENLSDQEKQQTWGGAAYGIKNTNLTAKHTRLDGTFKYGDFLEEASRMTSYQKSLQGEDFWNRMKEVQEEQNQPHVAQELAKNDDWEEHLNMVKKDVIAQKIRPASISQEQLDTAGIDVDDEEQLQQLLSRGQASPRAEKAMQDFFNSFASDKQQTSDSTPPTPPTTSTPVPPQNPNQTTTSSDDFTPQDPNDQ